MTNAFRSHDPEARIFRLHTGLKVPLLWEGSPSLRVTSESGDLRSPILEPVSLIQLECSSTATTMKFPIVISTTFSTMEELWFWRVRRKSNGDEQQSRQK